jgi:uncharacterized protein
MRASVDALSVETFLTEDTAQHGIFCLMKRSSLPVSAAQPFHLGLPHRRVQIRQLCNAIVREFQPEKIILFRSYAYGQPDTDSDVDLLVVMSFEGSPFHQAGVILNHVIPRVGVVPLDLLVGTAEQVNERLAIGDRFMREILTRGKVLYEANHRDLSPTIF